MNDSPDPTDSTDPADPAATPDSAADAAPAADVDGGDGLERRAFVRQMGTDTVGMAARLYGFSRIIARSATAAGAAMMSELESIGGRSEPVDVPEPPVPLDGATSGPDPLTMAPSLDAPGPPIESVPPMEPMAPPPQPLPPPAKPAARPDAAQAAILEAATSAIVAINWTDRPPQLTTATIHWDGAVARFATLGWSRRATLLRNDPRITLFVDDPATGEFVTVSGTATIVEGPGVRDAMDPLLRHGADETEAERRWEALLAQDRDRAVVIVEPDLILSGHR